MMKKTNLYSDFCDGTITKDDYLLLAENYDAKIQTADDNIETLSVQLYKQKTMGNSENKWLREFEQFRRKKKLSKDMVDALIDRINVYGAYELEIVFNYRDEYNYLMAELEEFRAGGVSA